MDQRDEVTAEERAGQEASGGRALREVMEESSAENAALAQVVYDFLGTREPMLVRAWFDQVVRFGRLMKGAIVISDGPITWESVNG